MKSILQNFQPISLDEMSGVKLLNRTDTKFVTSLNQLRKLLSMAEHDYRVQEINGQRIAHYYSTYFDTPTNIDEDLKGVTFKSSSPSVATVSEDGLVKAVGSGTAKITATSNSNANAYANCLVTVTVPITSIKANPNKITLEKVNS